MTDATLTPAELRAQLQSVIDGMRPEMTVTKNLVQMILDHVNETGSARFDTEFLISQVVLAFAELEYKVTQAGRSE